MSAPPAIIVTSGIVPQRLSTTIDENWHQWGELDLYQEVLGRSETMWARHPG